MKLGWADQVTGGGDKMGLAWWRWCGRFRFGHGTVDSSVDAR